MYLKKKKKEISNLQTLKYDVYFKLNISWQRIIVTVTMEMGFSYEPVVIN